MKINLKQPDKYNVIAPVGKWSRSMRVYTYSRITFERTHCGGLFGYWLDRTVVSQHHILAVSEDLYIIRYLYPEKKNKKALTRKIKS